MTTKSSNIFLGFNSHLQKEQKSLNTIPVAAGARLQPRTCLEFREPFPRMDKRSGHHFCSPELLHGHHRTPGLVVSTSHSLCWDQPLPPLHLRGSRDNFSVCTVTKMLPFGRTESQHPPKALENLSRNVQRNTPLELLFQSSEGLTQDQQERQKSQKLTFTSALLAADSRETHHSSFVFFHFCSSDSQKDCIQSCFWQSFVHF